MASPLVYNFNKIQKRFNAYEKTQANFAGKVALTRLGKEFRGQNGLIAQTYIGKHGFKPFLPFNSFPSLVNATLPAKFA